MPETIPIGGRQARRSQGRPVRVRFTVLLAALLLATPGAATATATASTTAAGEPPAALKVLTRNLYLGADLSPILAATDGPSLVAAVTAVFAQVQATDFPERAKTLAEEIADTDPHLVGLQEVELWRSQRPGTTSATHVEYDFLRILLRELAARGKHYAPVATVINGDHVAPRSTPGGLQNIRLTDRDVLLARTDLPGKSFSVANPQEGRYQARLAVPVPGGSFTLLRGWVAVDATLRGRTTRVVSTHLEGAGPGIQVQQGGELLADPLNTPLPTVLLGDLNSAAGGVGAVPGTNTPTYANLLAAGFRDAWTATRPNQPGFTFGQAPGLRNPVSTLSQRIDYVLYRNGLKALKADRVGEESTDRTPSGLWPSDHAGVWSVLKLPAPDRDR
ncbi:endonuclease [Streptomyces venezuelae]|uniref:Endonuclease n=1 Tax=Streptomyces venezuelae TaxID=54571 RepID=A0A5P2CUQ7_STRVZ|nr:endonuclease/exonuclease/phosphatase family protein [Streptomyces venezuelae]QES46654.1 endonuclease [Streptomyces venezuelae]